MIKVYRDKMLWQAVAALIAKASVEIVGAYFQAEALTGVGGLWEMWPIDCLGRAAARGVKVQMLFDIFNGLADVHRKNFEVARVLQRAGAEVRTTRRGYRLHMKAMVIDKDYALVGSHNLTKSSLTKNCELSLVIDDVETAAQVRKALLDVWADSVSIPSGGKV